MLCIAKKSEDMKRDVKCSGETNKKKTGLTTALLRVPPVAPHQDWAHACCPLALMSPQVPADHQAGQWCCHSTQIRELQGNMGMGHEMGSKDKNSMLSTGDLVCLTGVCPHNIWVHLHQPVLGYPPRPAEAGCRTTAQLRGAPGSNVLILIRKKWWYFHFDGTSLGNSPCTLAQQGKNVTVGSG